MKVISFIFFSLLAAITCQAQRAEFGIKAGLNLANIKDDAVPTTDSRTGYYVGALAHIHLTPMWALQPEIMYSLQGAEYGGGRNRLNYINVPVLLQYMAKSGLRVQTGPQLGLLTGATAKRNGVDVDIEDEVKSTSIAWSLGGGYLTRSGLGVDLRYNLGLTNDREAETPVDFQQRVWQLGLFYQFGHK